MNNQNILYKGRTRLDAILDYSEYYDYGLEGKIDAVLDISEIYDYVVDHRVMELIYFESFAPVVQGNFIITEDGYILTTEDNYMIEFS